MTASEKEQFCGRAASLFAPPDENRIEEILREAVSLDPGGGKKPEDILAVLKKEYERLFTDRQGEKIPLAESTYKPWTRDPGCGLAFAGNRGLLMGDSALHMREMFRRLALEVPEEFRSTPDHLVLEMEFLSLLYRWGNPESIRSFIDDHLDWIGELKERLDGAGAHPYYRRAAEEIHRFLLNERNS